MSIRLGVNVDLVATLRQARKTGYPDPVTAAALAELAGAHQITIHLREDRRHIQDRDLRVLRETVQTPLNLEMAATQEMLKIAYEHKPDRVTLVPERREEVTTEGGLDVIRYQKEVEAAIRQLKGEGIRVSLFIDADEQQIAAAAAVGAPVIELHTGRYANAKRAKEEQSEFDALAQAAKLAYKLGLGVNAGHGLNYRNIGRLRQIPEIVEYNIGHSIVARALMVGLDRAVREMKELVR